jgi:two-component system nitrogen regulation sensor histidine kinase NtrY
MALNNFRARVALRVFLILLLAGALMYGLFIAHWVVTSLILFTAIAGVAYELVLFVERTNREFATFLLSIKSADFSKHSVTDKRGQSFADLKKAMNIILEEFHAVRIEKESHFIYLQTAVEQMNTAIISFDKDGDIKLINQAAKTLLDTPYLKNIYSLHPFNDALCSFLTADRNITNPVLEISINGQQLKLSSRYSDFTILGVEHRLVSIQNIRSEIDNTELVAWEQLLRVLTHEIMNSVTPLSSLSATLKTKTDHLLKERSFDEDIVDDLSGGLAVIAKRSSGLISFVNHYRSFTTLPPPELKPVDLRELIERVATLKSGELRAGDIDVRVELSDDLGTITADSGQIEQVLINLVNNAADALAHQPGARLSIRAEVINGKTQVQVIDNGPGIDKDQLDKIFVPFFTTKSTGTGIGLSLSRQIMRMHHGTISVTSAPGHTTFSLEFP